MNIQSQSTDSSGNVFADLELDNADELFTRGKIGIQVIHLKILSLYNLQTDYRCVVA
jgi:predicted XRE-type DNA-binding protein